MLSKVSKCLSNCPLIIITIMSSSKVLKELTQLKKEYVDQFFQFTEGQKVRYTELLNKRREIVSDYYKNDLVFKPNSSTKSVKKEEVK